jgi:hypothetical protein
LSGNINNTALVHTVLQAYCVKRRANHTNTHKLEQPQLEECALAASKPPRMVV